MSEEFERTLDALERERERVEAAFREAVERLESRVARLREAAAAAERRAAEVQRQRPWKPEGGAEPAAAAPAEAGPWPAGASFARRLLNRFVGWLGRDYWHALDRRADGLRAELARQAEWRSLLQRRLDAQAHALERVSVIAADAVPWPVGESVREALNRAVEAVDLLAGVLARLHELIDAKDAEALQRAAHGPLRKMELVFEEFARQQEALLAELVGRRRQLDELLRTAAERGGAERSE